MRLISQLKEQRIVTVEEASLMASAVSNRALGIPVTDAMKGALRARMMKSMLMTIAARSRA
jgi:transcriptional regulator CtsR